MAEIVSAGSVTADVTFTGIDKAIAGLNSKLSEISAKVLNITAKINVDDTTAKASVKAFGAQKVAGPTVKVMLDAASAKTQLAQIAAQKVAITASVALKDTAAKSELATLTAKEIAIKGQVVLDDAKAKAELAALDAKQLSIQAKINLDDDQALAQLATIEAKRIQVQASIDLDHTKADGDLALIASKRISISAKVDLDKTRADAELDVLAARRISIEAKVDVNSDSVGVASRVLASLGGAATSATGALSAIPTSFVAIAAAAATLGPSLIAGVGALAIPLAGVGAGLGVLKLAFSGVGAAIQGMSNTSKTAQAAASGLASAQSSVTSALNGVKSAALGVVGAEASLKNTEANAADSAVRAAEAVKNAQQAVGDAARDAAYANSQAAEAVKNAQQSIASAVSDAAAANQAAAAAVAQAQQDIVTAVSKAAEANKAAAQQVVEAQASITQAVQAAAQANSKAAEQVANALQDQQDAISDAAYANEQAARSVQSAEENLAGAQKDARTAQEALTDARKDAATAMRDLNDAVTDGLLDQRDASLSLQSAQADLARLAISPGATPLQQEEAQLRVDQAQQRLKEANEKNSDLADQKKTSDAKGIEGSDPVVAAKQAIIDANKRVMDSEDALSQAREDQSRTAAKGEENVAKAEKAVADARQQQQQTYKDGLANIAKAEKALATARAAQEQTYKDGLANVAKAEKSLADARKAEIKAYSDGLKSIAKAQQELNDAEKNQARTKQTGAENLANAKQALEDAKRDNEAQERQNKFAIEEGKRSVESAKQSAKAAQDALKKAEAALAKAQKAAKPGSSSSNPAYDALTPSQKKIADALKNFNKDYSKLKEDAAAAILPGLLSAVKTLKPYLPDIEKFITVVGKAVGGVIASAAKAATGPEFKNLGKFLEDNLPHVITTLGNIGIDIAKIFADLFVAAGPAGVKLLDDFSKFMDNFAKWAGSKDGQKALTAFFQNAVPVIEAIGKLVVGLTKVAFSSDQTSGLKPLADFIGWFGDFIGNHPKAAAQLGGFINPLTMLSGIKWPDLGKDLQKNIIDPFNTFFGIGKNSDGSDKKSKFNAIGSSLIDGLGNGIGDALKKFPSKIGPWFQDSIVQPVKDFFGIKSPSTLMAGIGGNLIEGIENGILDKLKEYARDIGKVFDDNVVQPIRTFLGLGSKTGKGDKAGGDFIEDIKTGVLDKLTAWAKDIGSWFDKNVVEPIRTFFGLGTKTAKGNKAGGDFIDDFKTGVSDALVAWSKIIGSWFDKNVYQPILTFFGIGNSKTSKGGKTGGDFIDEMKTAMKAKLDDWAKSIGSWFDKDVYQPIVSFFGIGGKESKFASIGSSLAKELITAFTGSSLWANLKAPIKTFIVDVIDGGLIDTFNWVANKVLPDAAAKKIQIPHVPLPKGWQEGGLLPGQPSATDNMLIHAASGEFVVNAAATKRNLSLLHAINQGNLMGFATGGVVPDIKKGLGAIGSVAGKAKKAATSTVTNVADYALHPLSYITGKVSDAFTKAFKDNASGSLYSLLKQTPTALLSGIGSMITKELEQAPLNAVKGVIGKLGAPLAVAGNAAIVEAAATKRGWTGSEWAALFQLVTRESGFRNTAQNPTSTAYGMFQFLDSTWASYGGTKTSNPVLQTKYGLDYIASRYKDPLGAWAHETAYGWYDQGGLLQPGLTLANNQTGGTESVLTSAQWADAHQSIQLARAMPGGGNDYSVHVAAEYNQVIPTVQRLQRRQESRQRRIGR